MLVLWIWGYSVVILTCPPLGTELLSLLGCAPHNLCVHLLGGPYYQGGWCCILASSVTNVSLRFSWRGWRLCWFSLWHQLSLVAARSLATTLVSSTARKMWVQKLFLVSLLAQEWDLSLWHLNETSNLSCNVITYCMQIWHVLKKLWEGLLMVDNVTWCQTHIVSHVT